LFKYNPGLKDVDDIEAMIATTKEFTALAGKPVIWDNINEKIIKEIRDGMKKFCSDKFRCRHYECAIKIISSKYMSIKGMEYKEGLATWKTDLLMDCLKQGLCFFNHIPLKSRNNELMEMIKRYQNSTDWQSFVIPELTEIVEVNDNHIWSIYNMANYIVEAWYKIKSLNNKDKIKTTPNILDKPTESKPVDDYIPPADTNMYNIKAVPISEVVGGITYSASKTELQLAHNIQRMRRDTNLPIPQFTWVREVEFMKMVKVKEEVVKYNKENRGPMSRFFNCPIKHDILVTVDISYARGYYFNLSPIYDQKLAFRTTEWTTQRLSFHELFARSLILKHMGQISESGSRETIVRAIENSPNIYLNSSDHNHFIVSKRIAQNVLLASANLSAPTIRLFQLAPSSN